LVAGCRPHREIDRVTERQVEMTQYQLAWTASDRIDTYRREADAFRLTRRPGANRPIGRTVHIRLAANLRLLARRLVPSS
jgi:hypothetical protein